MGLFGKKKKKEQENAVQKVSLTNMVFVNDEDADHIMECLCSCHGLPQRIEGNHAALQWNKYEVHFSVLTQQQDDESKKYIQNNKKGAIGMFALVPTEQGDLGADIKLNLIHHLNLCNSLVVYMIDFEASAAEAEQDTAAIADETKRILCDFLKQIDGVLVGDNLRAAYAADGRKILDAEGRSDFSFYFPFTCDENPKVLKDNAPDAVERRNRNMKELFDRQIYVIELPLNEGEAAVKIRSQEDIVKRALGLLFTALYSESRVYPPEHYSVSEAREFIKEVAAAYQIDKLEDYMSPAEYQYFCDDNSDERTRVQYSWAYENLYIMEWCLGLMEWEFPDHYCNVPETVRQLKGFSSVEEIMEHCTMRSVAEILDKADYIYRIDWAAVDARIYGQEGPAGIDHGVSMEWHKALNWLICFMDAEWDDVDTPT